MQQIIDFFIRNKNFLLFCVLFLAAIGLTINSHSYHKNRYVSSANFVSGGIFSVKSSITDYFDLRVQNERLTEENKQLRLWLQNTTKSIPDLDSTKVPSSFNVEILAARVINNSYSKTKNQITINRGRKDGVTIDMGVISSEGIVGIVSHVSDHYASIQSVLNTQSQIVAKFKKSNHFGTLVWNAKKPGIVQLKEIPRIAPVKIGDTIVTDGKSAIFPEGILIGTVNDFEIEEVGDYYRMNIALFTDMTSTKFVYLVKRKEANEIKELEREAQDVE